MPVTAIPGAGNAYPANISPGVGGGGSGSTVTAAQVGHAFIVAAGTQTDSQPGHTRISRTLTSALTGVGRIDEAFQSTNPGVSRISRTITSAQVAHAYILGPGQVQTWLAGTARISSTVTAIQVGHALIVNIVNGGIVPSTNTGYAYLARNRGFRAVPNIGVPVAPPPPGP